METRPQSPQPPGAPRWVAMFYEPSSASWRPAAESPDRTPVLYAMGEMTQVKRARGEEATVALWGPSNDGTWHRFDPAPPPSSESSTSPSSPASLKGADGRQPAPAKLAERMEDRRHQVLMAGLSKAGLYDLTPDDATAVQALVDGADETTLRRVAHWMAVAAGRSAAG
jgi:hypothetical protein